MTVRIRIREKSASHDGSVFGGVGRAGDMGQISVGGSRIGTTGLCRHTRVFVAPTPFARSNRFLPVTCGVWLCRNVRRPARDWYPSPPNSFSVTVPSLTRYWVESVATSCWRITHAVNPRATCFLSKA